MRKTQITKPIARRRSWYNESTANKPRIQRNARTGNNATQTYNWIRIHDCNNMNAKTQFLPKRTRSEKSHRCCIAHVEFLKHHPQYIAWAENEQTHWTWRHNQIPNTRTNKAWASCKQLRIGKRQCEPFDQKNSRIQPNMNWKMSHNVKFIFQHIHIYIDIYIHICLCMCTNMSICIYTYMYSASEIRLFDKI